MSPTPVPGDLMFSSDLFGLAFGVEAYTCKQNIDINKINLKK